MEHKNSMSRVERLRREKVTRYSIRKYSFGAASVAVAALFMFLGNGAVSVQADEIQGNQVTESAKPQPEEDKSKPATEVAPALNKTQLESYISEIETKLSNGFYDNKTEESVAALKADLEAAKATLANATTQAELKQAYSKLVTTVNSKLKNKPVEKKEIPAVDTTEGKETVGKKAENTEPSATNSHAIPAKAEEGSGFRRNDSGAPQVTDTVNYTDGAGVPRRGVTSADASLSGTGTNGKTVEVTVETPDRGTRVYSALVTNGKWTVPLEEPLKASRDAFNKDQHETKITVKYIDVNNILNDETRVYLGRPEFVNNTVVAGQKEVLVKVPKDADNLWVGFANSNDLQVAMNNGNPESKDTSILTATMADTQNDPIFHIVKLTFVQNAIKEGSNGINIQAQSLYSAAGGALPGATEAPEAKRPTLTATNEAPTIASAVEGNRKTVAQGAQLDLASLVTVADTEDDAQVTVGNKVHAEVVSVNGDAATKTVDTNTQGTYTVKYKAVDSQGKESNEIEVTVVVNPAENEAPTVEIPFSNGKDVYVYGAEPSGFDIKIKDNSGVIKSATVLRGGNNSFNPVAGETDMLDVQYGYKANIFTSDTTASEQSPAIIHYRGLPGGELNAGQLEKAKTTGLTLGWRYVRVVDKAGNMLDNIAQGDKSKDRDLGAFNVIVKPQTYKYDPVELANANKVLVTNPAQLTTEELTNVKNSLKVEYSKTNDDAQLASKKGTLLDDAKTVVADVTESGNNFTVIYKDGSTDSIAKSKLIKSGAAPTVNTTIKASGSIPDSVPSSDSELTGTGIPGATVKVTVKNPETGAVISEKTAVVGEDGTWRLPLEEGLNSNTQLPGANEATRRFFAPKNPVEITQVVNGIETPSKAVSVAVGESKILPSPAAKNGTSVVAGAKEVTVTVPHDAGRSYFFYTAKGAKSTTEIALEQSQNGWSIIKNGDKATIKSVEKGVSVHTITLTMNENAPFQEGENKLEIISHNGPSSPPSRFGRYKINVTNEQPTLASKNGQRETTVNVGDTVDPVSLVTAADHEDDKDATLGTKVRVEVISVNGDESVKTVDTTTAGRYEVKYKAVDSQGKESDVLTHTVIVQGPAPTVELPYSNQANKQIYVYTGEKTDLTFKGADETEVKDLYLRGPGDISKDNTTDYGFTTGKITDGTVTTGVGEVSADKRTATVKMTGKTNLAAGKEWTSFVVSKDNDGKLSNTDYRAIDVDPNAKEKPGYVRFVVKNQTSKYDIATPTERVAVTDPANVTADDLAKIKEKLQIEYAKSNDDANLAEKKGKAVDAEDAKTKIKSVEKDNAGNLVVTYTDGSKDTRPLSDFVAKNPEVTPVKDPANLTDAEKAKVEEAVKKANPTATKVEVGNDGTTTVTFPDGSTASLTPEKTAKTADSNGLVDPEVTPVKDPANLTDAEKTKVEEAVKKANPTATKVEVGNDGTTTVTFPDGSTAKLTPEKTAKTADSNGLVDPEVTPVKDPANLTDAEKTKVEEAVKKANPTATKVEVGNDGTTTVTFPDGSTAKLTPEKTAKTADSNGLVDPEVTPVKDPANLTDAEKTKVEEAVKKANPTATKVEVGNDGTTTVTFPDGSTGSLTPEKTAKTADSNGLVDPAVTPVKDPANLTDAEKAKVEEAVKKANPTATKVEVGNDGTTTVTFPDGSTGSLTPEKTAKTADSNGLVDPAVTPVKDPANLTDAEKAKVEEAVKKANPTATKVEVGNDGTTTVTFPDGSTGSLTPEKTAKTADSNGLVDPAVTPVKDPANLTDAEKAKVEEAVKKANPTATKVEVGNDGTTTVTFPDGSTGSLTPEKTAKTADSNGLVDPAVTPVKDPANLTDAEKAKVEEAVKKANPTATKVEVGNDGTTTVTFPDGSTGSLTPEKIAKTADSNGLVDPAVTPVKDPANLTDAEKAKVEEAVKKANPTATKVEVGNDGTTTVTFPDGSTGSLTPEKTAKTADSNGLVDPAVTPVKDPANLTDAEKTKVEEAVKKANPTATKVEVGNDGTTTVTFPDGSTGSLTPEKTAKTADSNGLVDPAVTPVKDPANLTDAEKAKVEEAVKKANPTATKVEVGNDGTTTVTFPDGSTAEIPAAKAVEKAKDSEGVKDPESKTPVKDPANLTDAEKAKVADEVKKANPTATDVQVGNDGTATVTFPDGSTAEIPAAKAVEKAKDSEGVKDPESKTPVKDPANLTDAEKAKVADEVKKANPTAKDVEVGNDGTATVTFPDGSTAEIPAAKAVEKAKDAEGVKDPEAKTPVKDPANLTDAEKAKVADEVKKANPTATKVEVGNDGTTTVTFPDGSTAEIPAAKAVEKAKDSEGVKDPESKTPVKDPANLTDAEKAKVADEVKKANPTAKDVEVGNDGTATVTFPDGSTAEIPAAKAVEKAKDAEGVKDPSVTPVKDPANLTDAEKAKVADEVKKSNPTAKDVEVGNDGTVTVTFPDGSTAEIPAAKAVEKAKDAEGVKDPEAKTPVKDPANLTDAEKAKVADEVKKANPTATKVEVGNDGTTTVTFPDGSTAEIPAAKAVEKAKDAEGVKDPEAKTPVKDPANLTDAEKAKVADEVKKANPTAKDVEVGKDGTATVTFPDGSTAEIPAAKAVEKAKDAEGVKDPEAKTPVKDPANLTDAEKAKVADEVKKANPTATKVEVGNDGTATVTFPDGSTAEIPAAKAVEKAKDSEGVKDPESKTPVKDPANLTDAEKAKVADEVKKANPTAKDVEVGNDGTATVTFPDGSTAEIPAAKAVEKAKDAEGVKDPSVTPVKDPANLTDAEKAKVADEVKKANPTATDVQVGNDGTATVTFPDGSTAEIPAAKAVEKAKDSEGVKDPESKTPVKDPANLTDAEKAKVADEVKKANPTAKDVEVGNDGTATVTFPDGSTAEIPAAKAVEKAKDAEGVKDPSVTPVKDPANLTDAEKAKVADEVKKSNPTAKDVEVGKDGTVTVTFPDGSTAEIPAAKAVEKAKDAEGVKDPSVTPVKDPANLTDAEKAKVADEVKKSNPTAKDVEVGKDGTVTVTFPDGSTAEIPAAKAVEKAKDAEGVKDPEAKTPVKDPANLTDAEKAKVADEVKKANPTATDVQVGNDGTATVTFPDGSTAEIPAAKAVEKAKDAEGVKDPSVTPVKDPANLTDAEKAKVADEVKKSNPTAKDVEVGKDGTVTVTFPDGSTAEIPAAKAVEKAKDAEGVKDPEAKTPVKDPANLTDAEKAKVADEVKKANPTATKVEVGNDGTTTVTFPDGSTAEIPAAKAVEKAKDAEGVKDPEAKTPVKDPANLTDAEKAKVADEVKKANPTAKDVEVGKDGTATVTFPDGSTAEIPAAKAVEKAKDSEGVKDPESKTPVKDPANLTDAEKAKVEEAVKKANPTATKVEVGNDGTTTVTFPDGSTGSLTPEKTAKTADSNGLVDPAVTPVKDPANLTDAEKAKVEEAVKKANPTAKDVEVGKDGTATVTFPDGSTAEIPAAKAVEKAKDAEGVKDPEAKTPVKDPANLTDAEKAKVADEVKKANPTAKDVEVGNDGTATVTFPDGSTAEIPAAKAVEKAKDAEGVKDPEAKTPVKDPANLTDAEKAKVADEVKKANPTATDVQVGNDGTATVTFPDGSTAEIPAAKAVEKAKDAEGVKDPSVTPVKDPANLTDAEKAKVADEVKKSNPTAKDVEVGKDGTVTVTFPDGSTAEIPAAKAVEKAKDAEGVKDPEAKTPVKDPANLTDAEKAKVADEVKKANPTATKVEVGNDGTTTVTFPDGSTAEIPAAKAVEKAKDAEGVKDPEAKTPVKDPANLTDAEKAKVADEVKKANPTAKDVEVGKDGTATVTFPDGSTAEIPAAKAVEKAKDSEGVKDPESKTPVKDPANLTDAEKAKVEEAVKKANPTATKVEVGNDGTTTVTFPDGSTGSLTPEKTAKTADSNGLVDPAVTPVKDPANLTDAEKAKVEEAVKKANPTAKDVEVGKDGTATVTFPDGSTAEIPAAKAVEKAKDAEGVKDPEAKTPVKDPANLTDAEKAKVADEVKKANPTAKDVEVGNDGTATVTFPDGSTAEIPAAKAVEKAKDAEGVKDPEAKTPVKDPANLTDAEKAKVADEVKKANPTATKVEVGNDGTTTVTFPDGSTTTVTPDKTVKSADSNGAKDPSVTPVKDPANLTDAEKAKVADEVKKANPTAKDVEVGKDGTATVTFPDGSTAEIPAAKAVEKAKDAEGVKDPEAKTPVKDPANLTDAEKAKVADEVKKANPTAKDVEVGKDGTATVTFPDGSTAEIPAAKAVEKAKDAEGVKDPEAKTPVKDPANLTDAEKAKVADEVKKANPTAKDVEVGNDGTATVTFPDGSTAEIPAAKAVEKAKDAEGVKDPEAKTPVKDPANLTDAEKAKVADEVKKANPTATKVEVGNDGTTTVTFPDGSTTTVTPDKTVKSADSNGAKDPSVTPVKDPANLTDAEKAKVADEVKKANPTAKDVEVGKDGTATVTFPDGSTAEIPAAKAVEKAKDAEGVKDPEAKTPVKDPANLTDAEKAKVADEVKKANPTAKDVEVGKDGTATVTFPDGSTAEIPAAKAVEKAKDAEGVKDPEAKTPVKDPANLTDAEKAKVADEVKKANPTAKDVEVGKDGTATVTFPDGSTAVIPADKSVKKSDGLVAVSPAANQDSPAQAPAKKAGAKELPNTGTEQSNASLALALLAAATGGLLFAKKREEEE